MRKIKFILSLVGMVLAFYIMRSTGKSLITAATPQGIINLEFAYNQQKIDTIINVWQANSTTNLIQNAITNTYLDFLFLFFYGLFLFNCTRLIHQSLYTFYGKIGKLFSKLAVLAAFLDIIENGFMLNVLHHNTTNLHFMVGSSILKWTIVLVVVLYVLIGFLLIGLKAIKKLFVSNV